MMRRKNRTRSEINGKENVFSICHFGVYPDEPVLLPPTGKWHVTADGALITYFGVLYLVIANAVVHYSVGGRGE